MHNVMYFLYHNIVNSELLPMAIERLVSNSILWSSLLIIYWPVTRNDK